MRPVLCSFFFFILSFSSFDAAAMHTGGEDPHRWQTPTGHMIREYRNNWYLWSADARGAAVIPEGPRPILDAGDGELEGTGASLDVYNDWPPQVENEPLFQYLLPDQAPQPYQGFRDFVKNWYQSACAILHDSDSEDPKIIGSGASVGQDRVVTARHIFHTIPLANLFVRFSRYDVNYSQDPRWWIVKEQYIDVPVLGTEMTRDGLDAGFLILPPLGQLSHYTRSVPCHVDACDTSISGGKYALFHFAAGIPQVSVGRVTEATFGSNLHNEIALQAGPGASGGVIISQNFDRVEGAGVSIYRMLQRDGYVDRRLISFSRMSSPGWSDAISAPYGVNPNFRVVPRDALTQSGYEFVRWLREAHVNRRQGGHYRKHGYQLVDQHDKPLPRQQYSNHHIISLDDLLFLWDYYQRLDPETEEEIRRKVADEARANGTQHKKSFDKKARTQQLRQQTIQKFYGRGQAIMQAISAPFSSPGDSRFVWSAWNLFQGWKCRYRTDDPSKVALRQGLRDFSEKQKPRNFNLQLWNCVKALNRSIQTLKTNSRNVDFEVQTDEALENLKNIWMRLKSPQKPHPFHEEEWENQGQTHGHGLSCVRSAD